MAFRANQFGRFGLQARTLLQLETQDMIAPSDLDFHSARLLAHDNHPSEETQQTLVYWLNERGYLPREHPSVRAWQETVFPIICREFQDGERPIALIPSAPPPGCLPPCLHDFVPSTLHRPLDGWFDDRSLWRVLNPDGETPLSNVDSAGKKEVPAKWVPMWPISSGLQMGAVYILWVLDRNGHILVGPEEWGCVKHSSIAAGDSLWAAGEIGFLDGKVRAVNLSSGHYMRTDLYTGWRDVLVEFVAAVFRAYDRIFMDTQGLDSSFFVVGQ